MSGAWTAQEKFVAAVECIYEAAPNPTRWPQALQSIADVFDDLGAILVFGRDDGSFGHIGSKSLDIMLHDYFRSGVQDVRAVRGMERGIYFGRDAVTDADLVSAEELAKHPLYMLLARHGLKYMLAAPISPDPKIAVSIAVQRSINKPPYLSEDIETMTRLCRHAEKALRLSIRLLDAELGSLGLRESLSRLGIGVFVLDSLGRVVFSNSAGEHLLGNGIDLIAERLAVSRSAARVDFEQAVAVALRATPTEIAANPIPLLIDRAGAARPLTIYVLPVRRQGSPADEFLTHARALILAIDPDVKSLPDPAVVRDVFGLTLGEARVAALVGSGLPPREAAEKLGISEETVRTALKRVFSKVGVSRQSELAALLTRLVLR